MVKKLNPQAVLELICFTAFAVLMLYLVVSGEYLSYVTPKVAPYFYFTAFVMLIWAGAKLSGIFRPQYKARAAHCLVLAIPVLLLLLPHSTVSASSLSTGYLSGSALSEAGDNSFIDTAQSNDVSVPSVSTSDSGESAASSETDDNTQGISSAADASSAEPNTSDGSDPADSGTEYDDSILTQYGLALEEDGSINVEDDDFYPWLTEIFTNMERYEGRTITMKGFVYHNSEVMAENEFVPARMLMYCCAADLMPCGIICEYDQVSTLEEDAWVTVTGVIHIGEYEGEAEPQITVTSITPAEKPEQEYVYPW